MTKLNSLPTKAPKEVDKVKVKKKTLKMALEITRLIQNMYAQKKHSILMVLQGMDASGKDGVAKNLFMELSKSLFQVVSFKKPTEEEMGHDFLWRVHKHAPEKGSLVLFNRSHYEDILIQKVNNWIDDEKVAKRLKAINNFEQNLVDDNGTVILKFYLHISEERQLEKLQERMEDPFKFWKHNPSDWEEHKKWDAYMSAYEFAIKGSAIHWHIIPADNEWYRDYCIAKVLLDELRKLAIPEPEIVLPEK